MNTVRFVDVPNMIRWISDQGVERTIAAMTTTVTEDFRRWESFQKAPRVAAHSANGVIELMPTDDGETYSFKYVNGHPSNPARGFQTVTAFGVIADVHNGYPRFMAEMTFLTALRTAATSAMAARYLARPDSATMALIGTGAQAEFQALGMRAALGINRLRVFDVDPEAMAKFVRNASSLGFDVHVAANAADAVSGADIITTCTADKTNATILTSDMIVAGTHLNAIGGDCPGKTELDAHILERADVFVEFAEQTRIEGEIQQMAADFPVTELWEVVTGAHAGRTGDDQITVFDSVGFAIADFSALRYCRAAVADTAYESEIDLIAEPTDPKNLFGMLAPADARASGPSVRPSGYRDRPIEQDAGPAIVAERR